MSTTEQQAAAQSETNQLTDAEKKRVIELQQRLDEAERQASAPNPEGHYSTAERGGPEAIRKHRAFEAEREKNRQVAEALRQEFENAVSNPAAASYAKEHPATSYEVKRFAINVTGFDRASQPDRARNKNDIDVRRTEMIEGIARANPSYSIQDIVREYNIRSGNLNPPNVEIDYAGTLAARQQGFNVGSGLTRNLPETFAKDEEKRFGERNKFIGLIEGKMPEPTPPPAQAPPIIPQRPRTKTIQDSSDKAFAAPGYAQRGSDAYKGIKRQVHVLGSSLPVSSAELRTGAFELEGQNATAALFGIAPTKPRELTEADVSRMSQSEIEAYNRQVETWNQYVGYAEKQSKAFTEAQRLVSQGSWRQRKEDLKNFIREAKKEGVKFVTINTKSGAITVPIESAAYEIVKAKDIIGIGAVPNIPEGYAVAGSPQELVLIQEPKVIKQDITGKITEQTGFGIASQPSNIPGGGKDFFTLVGQRATELVMDRSKSPAERGLAAMGQVGVETFGGFVNLNVAAVQAYADLFNGTPANETKIIGGVEIELPETAPGAIIGGLSSSAYAAAVTRNPQMLLGGASEAYKQTLGLIKKQGLLTTIAQTTGYIAPFSPSTVIKAIPLRYTKLIVPVGKGIGKAVTTEIEPATIARQLKFGYGEQLGRVGVGYSDGSFFVGLPKPEKLPLARIAYTTERGGYRITEGPSGIFMTRPETLARLVKLGKLTEEEKEFIGIQKAATKQAVKIPDKILRTDLTPTGTEKPQSTLLAGKETSAMEALVVKEQSKRKFPLPALKGTLIEQYYAEVPFQRKDIDVDIGMMKKLPKEKGASVFGHVKSLFGGNKIKPDYDETMWIGKTNDKEVDNIILFRSEPGNVPAKTTKANIGLHLDNRGLTAKQFRGYKNWHVTNPHDPYVFFFGHDIKRLFVATSKSEAWGWGYRLGYSRSSFENAKNILAIKIKKGAVIEKDVNIRGITKKFDPAKRTVNPEDVDILTPNRSEWIILKKDAIEEIASGKGNKPFGYKLKQTSELYGEPSRTLTQRIQANKIYGKIKPDFDETMWIGKKKSGDSMFTEREKQAILRGTTTKEQIKRIKAEELFGEKLAERIATGLQAVAGEGRLFKAEGRSVEVLTGTGQKQKVFEAVTGKEALGYQQAFKTDPDVVFGEKVPKKVVQPGGKGRYKMLTYKFQGLRNVSALLELGGDLPKEGFLGTSKGREKEFFKRHEYLVTKAGQARSEKQAIKLKEAAVLTYKFAKARGWWVERRGIDAGEEIFSDVEPPNIVRSVGTGVRKGTPATAQAAKGVVISRPTTEQDIEGITGKKKQEEFISSVSTGREIKSTGSQFVSPSASIGKSASTGTKQIVAKSPGYKSISEKPSGATPDIIKSRGSEAAKSFGSESRPSPAGMAKPQPSPTFITRPSPSSPSKPITPDDIVPASPGTPFGKVPTQKGLPINLPQLTQFETFQRKPPTETLFSQKVGTESRRGKEKKGKSDDFLGNVPEEQISGMFPRKEVTTGIERTAKLLKKDTAYTRKKAGFTKLVTQRQGSVLSKKKQSVLFREDKKEVKRQKKKTGGFF